MSRETNCVVLLSGGLDSTVLLHWVKERYDKVFPLYIAYNSSHMTQELPAAVDTCKNLKLDLEITTVIGDFSGSSLTDSTIITPDNLKDTINVVVPFRNLIMLSLAAAYADKVNAGVIAISPTKEDQEIFRDCRREFYNYVEATLNKGAKYDLPYQLLTPFITNTKDEVILFGVDMDVDFSKTWSCYNPIRRELTNDEKVAKTPICKPCGVCPACRVREKGFTLAGISDPLRSN